MSELIPNLDDLRAKLATDDAGQYAHELADELTALTSVEDVDIKIDALVDRWLEVSDDDRG